MRLIKLLIPAILVAACQDQGGRAASPNEDVDTSTGEIFALDDATVAEKWKSARNGDKESLSQLINYYEFSTDVMAHENLHKLLELNLMAIENGETRRADDFQIFLNSSDLSCDVITDYLASLRAIRSFEIRNDMSQGRFEECGIL